MTVVFLPCRVCVTTAWAMRIDSRGFSKQSGWRETGDGSAGAGLKSQSSMKLKLDMSL